MKKVVIVAHTHWDREWWVTYQDFRYRLVAAIDEILAILEEQPKYMFLLDGQTIVLRDYLEIRPENRERLVALIQAGRLSVGPWYILPDEALVSGEAHLRNLILGEKVAKDLGVPNGSVGYLPDTFGHIGQMPQILARSGIHQAVVWRGVDLAEDMRTEFLWEAPDGSRVETSLLITGYYHETLPAEDDLLRQRVRQFLDQTAPRAQTPFLLYTLGADHFPADPQLLSRVDQLNRLFAGEAEFRLASLEEYWRAVRLRGGDWPVRQGELRAYGPSYLLPGVYSTRLYLKQANEKAQRALERFAEPFSALAWKSGFPDPRGFLRQAWDLLVQNHPHDSICGCSIDQVHREMITRFDQTQQIAEILVDESLRFLAAQVATGGSAEIQSAEKTQLGQPTFQAGEVLAGGPVGPFGLERWHGPKETIPIVVFNPLNWEREEQVQVRVPKRRMSNPGQYLLEDPQGKEVLFGFGEEVTVPFRSREEHAFWILHFPARVPGIGYSTYTLRLRQQAHWGRPAGILNYAGPGSRAPHEEPQTDLRWQDWCLENQYMKVEISPRDGSLTLTHIETGEQYPGLHRFQDGGDAGDEYNYSFPWMDQVLTLSTSPRIALEAADPLLVTVSLSWEWQIPGEIKSDGRSRSGESVPMPIQTFLTLRAGSPLLEIRTRWTNPAKDHRFRVLFPTGIVTEEAWASAPFEIRRRKVGSPGASNQMETPVGTHFQHGLVSLSSGERGFSLFAPGLTEYEVLDDQDRTLALTLLRCVGMLGKHNLLTRRGGAGPSIPTPDAQCLGDGEASYALAVHSGSWEEGAWKWAEAYAAPMRAVVARPQGGSWPLQQSLLQVQGGCISAIKVAEDGQGVVVRVYNPSQKPIQLQIPGSYLWKRVNLKEESLGESAKDPIALDLAPGEIATLLLEELR